jgi:ligand-binding sensor domain-containing protein/AraC-like DNA-binding protein
MNERTHSTVRLLLLLLCLGPAARPAYGQGEAYRRFDPIYLEGGGASCASCFAQDSAGRIWIGSDKGLYAYDGHIAQPRHDEGANPRVWCAVVGDSTHLYLGTEGKMMVYDYRANAYLPGDPRLPTDVRAMAPAGDSLWLGSLEGLSVYHPHTGQLRTFDKQRSLLPHNTIYSLLRTRDGQLYVGTYNGLCRYRPADGSFEEIPLPPSREAGNRFVNALLEDTARHCLWIGMEGSLLRYSPLTGEIRAVEELKGNSVKSLATDANGNLLAGTDNGLYVCPPAGGRPWRVAHDSRQAHSLTNNVVWSIFADNERHIWIGTDRGISLAWRTGSPPFIPLAQVTGRGDGNQFHTLFRDSRGYYWMGGTNGLIRFTRPGGKAGDALWYRMGDDQYALPHNRVRHIYEDSDRQLWIATDGSIARYDYGSRRFTTYHITDSTGAYNANWAYSLLEDERHHLWIATCLGGIFEVDKRRLERWDADKPYRAERNYTLRQGLSGMFAARLVPDGKEGIWALIYNSRGIDRIDLRTGRVSHHFVEELKDERAPAFLTTDADGMPWVGFRGGVARMAPGAVDSLTIVSLGRSAENDLLAMGAVRDALWASTTQGVWSVSLHTRAARRLNISNGRFTSLLYDATDSVAYLGGSDGFVMARVAADGTVSPPPHADFDLDTSVRVPWYWRVGAIALYASFALFLVAISVYRFGRRGEQPLPASTPPSSARRERPETIPPLTPIEVSSQDEKFLVHLTRLIEEHLADPDLNVSALCRLSDTTEKQLYRKVKQLTALSPVEYIKHIRMKQAATLLDQKKFAVSEVMYMVGFSNSSYFSKCFQTAFGLTPKQYATREGSEPVA